MEILETLKKESKKRIESDMPNQIKMALVMMLAAGCADGIYSETLDSVIATMIMYLQSKDADENLSNYRDYMSMNLRSEATTDDINLNQDVLNLSAKMKDRNVLLAVAITDMLTFYMNNWTKLRRNTYTYRNLKCIVDNIKPASYGREYYVCKTAVLNELLSL